MVIQFRDAIGPKTEPSPSPRPPEAGIGAINAVLQEKEAGTVAGLWLQHRPNYRVVAAFPETRLGPSLALMRATGSGLSARPG